MSRLLLATSFLLALVPVLPAQELEFSNPVKFMEAFSDAAEAGDFGRMRKLVENNVKLVPEGFRSWETTWCELSLSENPGQKEQARIYKQVLDQLGTIYRVVARKGTLVARFAWLTSLTPEQRKAKLELWKHLNQGAEIYDKATRDRTAEDAKKGLAVFWKMADAAERAGDGFWVANAYYYLAELYKILDDWYATSYCYAKGARAGQGSPAVQKEVEQYQLAAKLEHTAEEHHILVTHIDTSLPLEESRAKYEEEVRKALEKETADGTGAGGEESGGGSGNKGGGKGSFKPEGAPPRPTGFEGPEGWDAAEDLRVGRERRGVGFWTTTPAANGPWTSWRLLRLEDGERKPFPWLPGSEVSNDSGKVYLHRKVDGRELRPERLKLSTRPEPVQFRKVKYQGGVVHDTYVLLMKQPSSYKIMGYDMSSPPAVIIRGKGATTAMGKVRGQVFAVHDADGNGKFNDYGHDTVVIGRGRKQEVRPLSKYMEIGGGLYEVEVHPSGVRVKTKPYTGVLALLEVEYEARTMPRFLIARGSDGEATYYVDLMRAVEEPIWVVPTTLQISHGYISRGKGLKGDTISIDKGRSEPLKLAVDKKNTWKLGGAGEEGFHFLFETETVKENGRESIVLKGSDIRIYGNAGEEYTHFLFGHVLPEVFVRRGSEKGPVVARESTRRPEEADYEKNFNAVWHAKTLELKKNFRGDYYVKLRVDYEPLGLIESGWIQGR